MSHKKFYKLHGPHEFLFDSKIWLLNEGKEEKDVPEQEQAQVGRNLNRGRANPEHPARNRLRNRNQIRNIAAQPGRPLSDRLPVLELLLF